MRKLLFLCGILWLPTGMMAQKKERTQSAYIEILGNGLVLSANYERQLKKVPGMYMHIGIGLGGYGPNIPLGLKYLINRKSKHFFIETGAGITLAEKGVLDNDHQNQPGSQRYKFAFVPSLGLRYQASRGFLARFNYTPFYSSWDRQSLFLGLSFGWSF